MVLRSRWGKMIAMLLCTLIVFSTFNFGIDTAAAEGADDLETVDYVLILDCTVKAVNADEEGIRKAAAKMFVDLLPVDNARVAVFKVGDRDAGAQKREAETAKTYQLRQDDGHMADALYRMQCIYKLWDFDQPISTISEREKLKKRIDEAYVQKQGSNSDTHCAVYAAIDTLKYWQSTNACILLVSEEFTADYNKHRVINRSGNEVDSDHSMWDDVQNALIDHENWIMNWVDLGKQSPNVRTMISDLCTINRGEVCFDFGVSRLPEMIAGIVSKYTGSDEKGQTQQLDARGNATLKMPDFVMLTEANIVVTGEGVEKVTVTDGRGSIIEKPKDDIWFSANYDPQDASRFLYSAVKMIRPTGGSWTVNVKGKAGTQVFMQTIQTLEPDIKLACNVKSGETIGIGKKLQFTATYQYAGEDLHCGDEAYEHFLPDAKLYYTHSSNPDKKVDISHLVSVDSEQYVADFTVQERGTYNFYFYVESNRFKSGIRHANPLENITVENHAPVALGALSDINDVPVGQLLEGAVNVGGLFVDQDGEELNYTIILKKDGRPVAAMEPEADGFLNIRAPEVDGEYIVELYAEDTSAARSETVSFALRVINQPPVSLVEDPYMVKMIAKAPQMLVSVGLLPKEESGAFEADLGELFMDPEGLPLSISVDASDTLDKDGEAIIETQYNENTGTFTATAKRKGQANVNVTAVDSAGASTRIQLNFKVRNTISALFVRYWWLLAAIVLLAVILIILMASRTVKGRWTVEVEDHENRGSCSHDFRSLPASKDRMLKRTKVNLLSIARRAVISEEVQDTVRLNRLPADVIVFHGTLAQGKTVTFSYSPKARIAVTMGETVLTARKKYKLLRNSDLAVVCKDADNEEILTVKVSFR